MAEPARVLAPNAPTGAAARVRLTQVAVTDFRNIARADIAIPADGIAVVGDNGHGKTNLLEAIGYLETLRSLRGARDRDLVRFGAEAFHLSATVEGATARTVSVGANRAGIKRVQVDGAEQPRLADALGAVPSVCFAPADVALVTAGPGERRRFLDIVLALTAPAYLAALRLYRAALSRRNAALRAGRLDRAAVRAWEPALATHGATIIAARVAWAGAFADRFAALAAAIGEAQPMAMAHGSAVAEAATGHDEGALAEALARALEAAREQDVSRGMTQAGPHRDDLRLTLAGRDLRATGSAGQHRTAAIALRLLEGETFRARAGVQPIVLLDDPFAELDRTRAGRVLALLDDATHGGVGQVVLCVPRADEVPAAFTRLERWQVRDGAFARTVRA
jgi:DNA replication and repair protein RecF